MQISDLIIKQTSDKNGLTEHLLCAMSLNLSHSYKMLVAKLSMSFEKLYFNYSHDASALSLF